MFGLRKKTKPRPLNYDTEIELVFPAALYRDPVVAPLLRQVGIPMEASGNKIMLFTDVQTVAALNAKPDIMKVGVEVGIGTVLYGWNCEERTSFLIGELRAISEKYAGDDEAQRLAVFDLHRFVHNGMLGKLDPNPFASPLPTLRAFEDFDLATAIAFMASPDQINKPKAYDYQASQT